MASAQPDQTTRPAKIGLMLPHMEKPDGQRSWSQIREMAELGEAIGMDSLWVVDHFLFKLDNDDPPRGIWECWSLLSALAACTKTVELGTLVLGTGFRNPALLAKMADTVDEISGGRLILGLGAGYHKFEYDAFGFPFDNKFSRFEEALQIIHGLLRNGHIDFEGRFYSARDCELKPRGPRPDGPPILIGSMGHKMLRLLGRYADMWNGFWDYAGNSPGQLAEVRALIDEACVEVGRDPATLDRTITVLMADDSPNPYWKDSPSDNANQPLTPLMLNDAPADIAQSLRAFVAEGASHIQIHLDPTTPQTIERLAPVLEALDVG
jgi:alkanesulfonate monooxygenase SsuD/methylene tetrahydromethanopterin reductase-like flavin-dependent oxidoreductase (luciferase family)